VRVFTCSRPSPEAGPRQAAKVELGAGWDRVEDVRAWREITLIFFRSRFFVVVQDKYEKTGHEQHQQESLHVFTPAIDHFRSEAVMAMEQFILPIQTAGVICFNDAAGEMPGPGRHLIVAHIFPEFPLQPLGFDLGAMPCLKGQLKKLELSHPQPVCGFRHQICLDIVQIVELKKDFKHKNLPCCWSESMSFGPASILHQRKILARSGENRTRKKGFDHKPSANYV